MMKKYASLPTLALALLLILMATASFSFPRSAHAAALSDPNPPGTPANLRVPTNEVRVWDAVTYGFAYQMYQCLSSRNVYTWTFIGPYANLENDNVFPYFALHSAVKQGPNPIPMWQEFFDYSFVQGSVIARSPGQNGAIPLLLLKSIANGNGGGPFANVNFIQRLDTAGGLAPTSSCSAANSGQIVKVNYFAHYYFYAPS